MLKKILHTCVIALAFSNLGHAEPGPVFLLVSPEEVAHSQAHMTDEPSAEQPRKRSLPAEKAPRITLLSPDIGSGVATAPMKIRVQFSSSNDAEIVPDTFRAYYGSFRIDITDRLRKHYAINKQEMSAENVNIPSGKHRLRLAISDTQGRRGESDFNFSIP